MCILFEDRIREQTKPSEWVNSGTVLVSDFDYELPEDLIAQQPPAERGSSRMLVVSRAKQNYSDDTFQRFPEYLGAGDCLVLNNTRVFPARLLGRRNRENGAEVELFLIRPAAQEEGKWRVLAKPGKRVRVGDELVFQDDRERGLTLRAKVLAAGEYGERTVQFESDRPLAQVLEEIGRVPLPPYIHRAPDATDAERYQTVFAQARGSIAAPTAGLHFTEATLDQCRARGVDIAYVTLHVGLGTFAPLRESDVSKIELHEEFFEIRQDDATTMKRAKRLVCVGTTSVRTIETALLRHQLEATSGETNLFIYPGYRFRGTGAMLTNFHLPQSSLLLLVSAFGGQDLMLRAYKHAVQERYQFFSYGDCMLIE